MHYDPTKDAKLLTEASRFHISIGRALIQDDKIIHFAGHIISPERIKENEGVDAPSVAFDPCLLAHFPRHHHRQICQDARFTPRCTVREERELKRGEENVESDFFFFF